MNQAFRPLTALLASLEPELQPGHYAFVSLGPLRSPNDIPTIASFKEKEGWTLVVEQETAQQHNLTALFTAAWITLTVHSDLAAIGLTAVVSQALADRGIACNIMAGAWHDHLFIPPNQAENAMETLRALQQTASE
ncbi:ACT domain-containing protein [Chitinimonas sp. BJB300]|uniref:ACT domain-containing protein n=1 Tax=Chitinimonas sp. BJB300 TaxID=1559339 RepID=UPI000C0FCED4|nr:ACT domain-containing protein [Chitinimonas sp. BJB300]PHV10930.1 acetyltransferase [Chitinimonas sp. BJB300]TSJ89938.1 ACT domain-containing protein [Chitinimonas sp. BJB300]